MSKHVSSLVAAVLVFFLAVSVAVRDVAAQGQLATATLSGVVKDKADAVVPEAALVLENLEGGTPYDTKSNTVGEYAFPQVRPGRYRLIIRKAGFADAVVSEMGLMVSQTAHIDIVLKPGSLTQTVEVSASALQINSENAELSGTVTTGTALQMPLTLRDTTQLVNLVPGVTADLRTSPAGDVRAGLGGLIRDSRLDFSMNGGQRQEAAEVVDGIDITYTGEFYPETPIIISPDFVNEMKVQTNNVSAAFGPGSGVVNIITRTGTNAFHGSGFEFLQSDKLNANAFFNNARGKARAPQHRNQYGGAVGGPIKKDRLFFFADWEQLKNRQGQSILTTVPTQADRSGNFSDLLTTSGADVVLYNPFSTYTDPTTGVILRNPFPGNQIPANMVSAFSQKLSSYYPNPNTTGLLASNGAATQLSNLLVVGSSPISYDRFDVKGDYDISANSRLMVRTSRNVFGGYPVQVFNNVANPNSLSQRDYRDRDWNTVASWSLVISPTLVMTQSASYTRVHEAGILDSAGFDPSSLGGPFANGAVAAFARTLNGGTSFPNMQITGYAPMGSNSIGYNYLHTYPTGAYQVGLVKETGKHSISTGFKFALHQTFENYLNGYSGTYSWTGGWTNGPNPLAPTANTGNALADIELGLIDGGSMQTGTTTALTSKYFGWYAQDDWHLTSRLTLNLGLRYDFELPFTDRYNHIARFNTTAYNPIGTQSGPNSNGTLNSYFESLDGNPLRGAVIFPSEPGASRQIVGTDFTALQPRLGLAYRITNKLVFRTGVSKMTFQSPSVASLAGLNGGGSTAVTSITPSVNGITPSLTLANVFPNGFLMPQFDTAGALSLIGQPLSMATTSNRTPYQWQWNAGFEYAVSKDGILSVSYAGSSTHHLICPTGNCVDQVPISRVMQYGPQLTQTVPNPFYGIITDPTSALGKPTIQLRQLLTQYPEFGGTGVAPNTFQGANGNAFYGNWNALEVGFRRNFSAGLSLMAAYTWSKNLTNVDGPDAGWLGPAGPYQNMVNFSDEYSRSAEDVPQRLVLSYVYDLPFGRGKHWASDANRLVDAAIGGWSLAGVITLQSGFPIPVSVAGVTTGTTGTVRPNMVSGVNACSNGNLNPAAFSVPANYTFGNAPRELPCRIDASKNWDASILRNFNVWDEHLHLQLRGELFNAFNNVQFGMPNTVFNGASFGSITSTYNQPRVVQFGIKVLF